MGAGSKAGRQRREPKVDIAPPGRLDLRLAASDRLSGSHPETAAAGRRQPAPRRKAANDDSGRSSRKSHASRRSAGGGGGRGGGRRRSFLGRLTYWTAVLGLWTGIAVIGWVVWIGAHLPAIQSLEVPPRPPTVQILGAGGTPLATRGEMGGAAVPLKELPKHLPQAFIAIEDRRFYSHFGVDPVGVARAAVANVLRRGVAQGGSTLTQQLAKNLFLTQERTFERKVQELLLAFWLEHRYSKAQILELYVNRVYFGAGAYGVEGAAQRYFGKSARAVTVGEAALLAGLVRAPSRLAPTRNPEGARRRAAVVLAAMRDEGFITPEVARTAAAKPAQVARTAGAGSANYVADWVMDVLDDLIGRFEEDLVVETTIDMRLQNAAERAMVEELSQRGERAGVEQGALVAMMPDGAVRALVGGRNYAESQFNRAIAARRQPGSAFKPFVYLTAIERGMTPDTLREDRPVNVRGWRPANFSREYAGTVTLTHALAASLNTVAVQIAMEVTPKAVVQTAHRMGIASPLEANASLALGTSEVSVLEMATAFTPFANGGIAIVPHVVSRIRTARGKPLYQRRGSSLGRIVQARNVAMMNAMMRETVTSGTARSADAAGWPAAGKTGTSQDFRDAWFVGYTARMVTAVWLGNDDATSTRKVTGGGLPVAVWSRFMRAAHQGVPAAELPGVAARFPPSPPPPGPMAGARPLPPAAIEPQRPRAPEPTSLDRWILETVFGTR